MLCNQNFIKIFGTVALVLITSHDREQFRLMGTVLSRVEKKEENLSINSDHALLLLDGIEERAKRLHAESLARDLAEIARVKAILKGESP